MSNSNSIPRSTHEIRKDLTGQVFGRLTVVRFAGRLGGERAKQVSSAWECLCECGTTKVIYGSNLKAGKAQSCGCMQRELAAARMTRHGMTGCSEYESWRSMWDRCTNPNDLAYERYKDKCPPPEWRDFQKFLDDMGRKPDPSFTLDRVHNDKPYGPGNCRWATWHTQTRNRSVNIWVRCNGTRMILADAAKALGTTTASAKKLCPLWPATS